jgi:cytochrome c oxidase subunit II
MGVEEVRSQSGSEEITAGPQSRAHLRQMLLIGLISSLVGIALALLIDWFPTQASVEGEQIDTVYDVLLIFSVPVFVLVEVVVLYSVWRFRMKPGEELKDGPPIHGNTRLEIIWTAIPAILLVGLCSYSYIVLTDIEEAAARALGVRVVGEQFTWTFHYRGPDGQPVASPQLYVPVGRQVNFTVQSKDVVHDFWVPAFRMKIDAVPGIDTHLRVTPKRLGQYPVVCAELCGLGHSVMRQTAHVVSAGAFDRWLQQQAERGGGGGGGGQAGGEQPAGGGQSGGADGKAIFSAAGCNACHTLADAGASGTIGPDLDDALRTRDDAFIRESIVDPNAVVERGYSRNVMPTNFDETLDPAEIDALVQYLARVTKG